jgi:3-methyladenine DNA glycosylase AlkC
MAEPLKNHFDERVPRTIATQIAGVWPAFGGDQFLSDVLQAYDDLGLMDRGRHIARTLRKHLPDAYPEALGILLRSIGDRPARTEGDGGMASFLYLPHVQFVEEFGLEDFEASLNALYVLTQRFTGEFSVRPFIERYEAESLALLEQWTQDSNAHVRRLVSEGTRPRLPWAARLRRFQEDPAPVLSLLERLRDDPEEFVRRSVANNLNDIGKDHPTYSWKWRDDG